MAHDHESIEYGLDEVKEVFDASVLTGTIVDVDYDNDTANVSIGELGLINNVSIFYHCEESNTIVGGSVAFYENDEVYILNKNGILNPSALDLQIVGLVTGLANCCYIRENFDVDLSDWIITESTPGKFDYLIIAEQLYVEANVPPGWSGNIRFKHIKQDIPVEFTLRFSSSGIAIAPGGGQSTAWIEIYYFNPNSGHNESVLLYFLQDRIYTYVPPVYWLGTGIQTVILTDYIPANAESIWIEIAFFMNALDGNTIINADIDYLTICGK